MNLVDAYQLHFCVFFHTLYCLIHYADQLEKNSCYEIHFHRNFFEGFYKTIIHGFILNMGYLHAPSSVSARQVPSWRRGTQDKLILAARWQELISLAPSSAPSLHQVIFLQVELQDRVFHCGEHKPNIFGICGACEVGINYFLCVRVEVNKHA